MKTEQIVLTLSIAATAALTKKRFVSLAGAVPAAGAWCPGVANAGYDIGEQAGVDVTGAILVEAGAAVTAGTEVQTDASGRAITKDAGVGLGRALDAASAASEFIRVLR